MPLFAWITSFFAFPLSLLTVQQSGTYVSYGRAIQEAEYNASQDLLYMCISLAGGTELTDVWHMPDCDVLRNGDEMSYVCTTISYGTCRKY
jgi:hypothetical protein